MSPQGLRALGDAYEAQELDLPAFVDLVIELDGTAPLGLTPDEKPAVLRALVGTAEDLEFLAVRRGQGPEAAEMREEVAQLRAVVERISADQSPGPSRMREVDARYTGARR